LKPLEQVMMPSDPASNDEQLEATIDQGSKLLLAPPPPPAPPPPAPPPLPVGVGGNIQAGDPSEASAAPAAEASAAPIAEEAADEDATNPADADETPRPPFRRLSYEELLEQRVPAGMPRPPVLPGRWEAVWEPSSRRYYYRDPTYRFYLEHPPMLVDDSTAVGSCACVTVTYDCTDSIVGGSGTTAAAVNSVTLHAGNLELADGVFDPLQPEITEQLIEKLGVGDGATVQKLPGFQGGLNEGVWTLTEAPCVDGSSQDWIMKLVRGKRLVPALPTEAENLDRLASEHPGIGADALLAFPIRTLGCLGPSGKTHDLIVMRKAPGERLAEVICQKWYAGQPEEIWGVIQSVGAATAEFHARYSNTQHGDLQPSNIFWDQASRQVTFIDVGGMGVPTERGDVDHFTHAVHLLKQAYGEDFEAKCLRAFQSGYFPSDEPDAGTAVAAAAAAAAGCNLCKQ